MGNNDNFEKLLASMKEEEKKKKTPEKPSKKFVKNFYIKDNGEYIFRLLPNLKDPLSSPFYKVYLHLGFKMPKTGKNFPLKCLGNRCPLCEHYREQKHQGKTSAWRYEAKERFIYYGLDKNGDIIKLNLTEKVHQTIIKAIEKELTDKENPYNPLDLDNGCFLKFRKDTKEKNGRKYPVYSVQIISKSKKEIKPKMKEALMKLPALEDTFLKFSAQDYVDILRGKEVDLKNKKNKKVEPKQVFNKEEDSEKSENSEENQEHSLEELMEEDEK